MRCWILGAATVLGLAPTVGSAVVCIWDVENLAGPNNYMSGVVNEGLGSIQGEPCLQLKFNGLWSQFGQVFQTPRDWTSHTGFSLLVQNLEGRDITFGFRFDRNAGYTDYMASALFLRAGETRRFYLDLTDFVPMQYGMQSPMPVMDGYYTPVFPFVRKPLDSVYRWQIYSRDTNPLRIKVTSLYGQSCNYSVDGLVDHFGQFSRGTWPWKVSTVQDMRDQKLEEDSYLMTNPGPGETFGSNQMVGTPTGKWRLTKTVNGKYYFVSPEGKFLWSLGVASVSTGAYTVTQGRENMFVDLPGTGDPRTAFYGSMVRNGTPLQTYDHYAANVSEKYGATWQNDWKQTTRKRLRSWGINTLGAGFDMTQLQVNPMPFIYPMDTNGSGVTISTPYDFWGPVPDPFSPNFQSFVTAKFAQILAPVRTDPNLIGVYSDGEHVWGVRGTDLRARYAVPLATLVRGGTQPAKGAFRIRMQTKYVTIDALNAAWGTSISDWDSFQNTPIGLSDAQVTAAVPDLSYFLTDFGKAYYWRVKKAIKTVVPNALYLGSKDAYGWCPDEIFEAQACYCDVISVDQYDTDAHTPWAYFASLKRPVIIAEFSFNAREGNSFPNLTLPECEVSDQATRAIEARKFLNSALGTKNIIGAHWFKYVDDTIAGKAGDYQNIAFGLVDVTDRPYTEMTDMIRNFATNMYTIRGR